MNWVPTEQWQPPPAPAIHGELTADGKRIVLIATGQDHEVAYYAKLLATLTPLFKASKPPGALITAATWAGVVQLSMALGPVWRPGPRLVEWVTAELARRTANGRHQLTTQPPEGRVPRQYQVDGALMIGAVGRALLFDEQGTGKTMTTILGLVERAVEHEVLPVVCVVPASVVDPWVDAWTDWAPQWPVVAWRGPARQRPALAGSAQVYVTSYDTARRDAADKDGPLVKLKPNSVIVDEVHLIKSPYAMRSLAARRLAKKTRNFVGLSGTPITHHPGNLWPTLEALEPLAYPSSERFDNRYLLTVQGDYKAITLGLDPATEPEFRANTLGQHRRVAKADVLDQLPPKVYSPRYVELPEAWRKVYDDLENQFLAELPDGQELSIMSVLAQLNHLSQLASAAADAEITVTMDEETGLEKQSVHLELKAPSWKVDELLAVLEERPGQPVVTFAPSKQLVRLAGAAAEQAGLQVGYVVGGQRMSDRTDTVARFQAGKLDLLATTLGAGGIGLTLTAAGTEVFLQSSWSLVERLQAEDRCHRIGSEIHDSIEIIDIIAKNTIDTRVRGVLRAKAGHLSDLLQDPRIVKELLGGTKR